MSVINKDPFGKLPISAIQEYKQENFGRIWIYSTISVISYIRDFL